MSCEFEEGLFSCPEGCEGNGGLLVTEYGIELVVATAIVAEIDIQLLWDGFYVAPHGGVADDTEGGAGAMAEVEVYVGVVFERRFAVRAKNELLRGADAVLLLQGLHQEQIDGQGKPTVVLLTVAESKPSALGADGLQSLFHVELFDMVVEVDHSKKPKAAICRIICMIYSLEVSLHWNPKRCNTLQV